MSTIKISALGGLGENGKNMYLVEVDDRIFVLDAGFKYSEVDLYGVDAVIPDMSYLLENRHRIEGIFISHGHEDHIGALPYLLRNINIRVYGTHFSICLIEDLLTENDLSIEDYKLYRINENKTLKFGDVIVSFFNTTHSIPESIGIAITTLDGTIVYAPDFSFNSSVGPKYKTSFDKITDLSKKNVIAVMPESLGTHQDDRASSDRIFEHTFNNVLTNAEGRIIVSAFSSDLNRIQRIIDLSIKSGRKIAVIGRKAQRNIDIAIKSEYLKIPSTHFVNLRYKNSNDEFEPSDLDPNLVIIASGVRHEPYLSLIRMVNNKDRLVQLNSKDSIVMVSNPVPGTEKIALSAIDALSRQDINVTLFDKKILRSSHANAEDLKLFYSMLKPKYIIPIIGEFRHLYEHAEIAKQAGFDDDHIVIVENGQVITFENGQLAMHDEKIPIGDIFVDGTLIGAVDEAVIQEREKLAAEGAIILSANLNLKSREVVGDVVVTSKGFVPRVPLEEFYQQVEEVFNRILQSNSRQGQFDLEEIKKQITQEIGNITYRQLKKRPIVIPILIPVQL